MSQTHPNKRVIINADDFGFSPGVTEGILRAHREGIVTSTTVAANMRGAEEAVARLAEAPGLGVGVHLNVTQGPVLTKSGEELAGKDGLMRWKPARLIWNCILRPWLVAAVEAECAAQIRWVLDRGIHPAHLDGHQHVYAFPPIFVRVAALARRYNIPFVRWPHERLPGSGWPPASARRRGIRRCLNFFSRVDRVLGSDVLGTSGTWGIAHTGEIDAAWLIRAAASVPPMTHPGLGDDLDPEWTRLRESRRREMEALSDPKVKEAFQNSGVELIHYGQLR
jgi:predicted glycoside hydrolase/deacetylase ChbG (UPF0249 family)